MSIVSSGKTINQLNKIENVTGNELIPMAVLDSYTGTYSTYAITLDNFLKLVNDRISYVDSKTDNNANTISAVANTAYSGIIEVNNKTEQNAYNIITTKSELNTEIIKANTYIAYNSSALVRIDSDLHDIAYHQGETTSYISYISYALSDLSSYTHTGFSNNDIVDGKQQKDIEDTQGIDRIQQSYIDTFAYIHSDPWEIMENSENGIFTIYNDL